MSESPEITQEQQEALDKLMDSKLVDHIVNFAVNSVAWSVYKSYLEEEELGENFFDNVYSDAMGVRITQMNADIMKVLIQEAVDDGFLEQIEDDAFAIGVPMVMVTLTQKGKDHIKENTRESLCGHFQGIIDHIRGIE